MQYFIGLDYGTDSVRALVVDEKGRELATSVHFYSRWARGLYCDPDLSQYRQHPQDYLDGLEFSVNNALLQLDPQVRNHVAGISVDTTGSTPVAVDHTGMPLALTSEFGEDPDAMFILWKDHTANREADEINELARKWQIDYTKFVGGIYSSEWFWAKILHTIRKNEKVRKAAYSWVEHCDWIPAILTANTNPLSMKRSRCAAGHKAMWHEAFDGLPSEEFLTALDPLLSGLRGRLYRQTSTSEEQAGTITSEWAERLGLPTTTKVGVGAFDAHMGAIGAAIEPYSLVRVMGTSTCDMIVAPVDEVGHLLIRGICGQVDGSILPGMMGMEAGQSAFGDVYAWFQQLLSFPITQLLPEDEAGRLAAKIIPILSEKAAALPVSINDPVALDWFNGRRTPDANHTLKAAISGLNLGSDAPRLFKALVEATAFGARSILERFQSEGVPVRQVIGIGGVSKKSPFVMQTLADILNRPIKIVKSDQACALGAAICAATVAGAYSTIEQAQSAMGSGYDAEFTPRQNQAEVYNILYQRYLALGNFIENASQHILS